MGGQAGTAQGGVFCCLGADGAAADGGIHGLGIGDAVDTGVVGFAKETAAVLLLYGMEVVALLPGFQGDVSSCAEVVRTLFAGDVRSFGCDVLSSLKVYVAKGVEGAADVLALLGGFCMAVVLAVGAEGLAALGLEGV